ncbi:hypothetical protein Pan97_16980 [Bremerella volcania]|uniref:Lipocalin-like domain-containing protein n=1 Tax=Bremerella volcania TaxID=2527984 RepID=A0A518C625_9BACT|nr:hypothetical protein [Bremerella volcania]QDU74685.1 hypothetical protein Pan97_16980 [Bremerella volcania]
MNKLFSIGILIACIAALTGCQSAERPLEGTWHGIIQISGPVNHASVAPKVAGDRDAANESPHTDVAQLTMQFVGENELRIQTEPIEAQTILPPAEKQLTYEIAEALPDLIQLKLQDEDRVRTLQLRFSDDETMTVSEMGSDVRLLPVKMKRVDEL